jgi:hypothetical protein
MMSFSAPAHCAQHSNPRLGRVVSERTSTVVGILVAWRDHSRASCRDCSVCRSGKRAVWLES